MVIFSASFKKNKLQRSVSDQDYFLVVQGVSSFRHSMPFQSRSSIELRKFTAKLNFHVKFLANLFTLKHEFFPLN